MGKSVRRINEGEEENDDPLFYSALLCEVSSWDGLHWFPTEYVLVTLQNEAKVRHSIGQICPFQSLPNVFMQLFLPHGYRVNVRES